MNLSFSKGSILLISTCLLLSACDQRPTVQSLDEAHRLFAHYCEEDSLPVKLIPLEDTLWIYVPVQEALFETKASGLGIKKDKEPQEKPAVRYLDTAFNEDRFEVTYDIATAVSYPQDPGYKTSYNEKFNLVYQTVWDNLRRTYLEADIFLNENEVQESVDDGLKAQQGTLTRKATLPTFVVIIFADIKAGLQMKMTMVFEDYKKEMSQAMAMEESQKRRLTELSGNKDLIGDVEGESLDIKEMTWPAFLSKQVTQRIMFTFGKSDHPAPDQPEEAILEAIAQTVKIYGFEDFSEILLDNLRAKKEKTIGRAMIEDYDISDLEPKGKLHTIRFLPPEQE